MGKMAQKKGKTFPLFVGLPLWLLSSIGFIFFNTHTPVWVIMIAAALIAAGGSAGNLCTWAMLTDVYDVDELRTSKRREGLYSGATTFLRKAASGVAVVLMGASFQLMGFDQNQYNILKAKAEGEFDPSAFAQHHIVAGMRTMFVLIPIVLLMIVLIFASRNKLNHRRFAAVQAGIKAFEAQGNLSGLTDDEVQDIEVVTGLQKEVLWGNGSNET